MSDFDLIWYCNYEIVIIRVHGVVIRDGDINFGVLSILRHAYWLISCPIPSHLLPIALRRLITAVDP